ncbi:MAG: hypothetical protein ACR2NP_15175, partial [Pirellulaceae bacterium]
TKCTEFLRFGAAGASGCVIEPLAIPNKFPHPRIHVHYARGCTLGEAFYQSIHGPYQILIVGDALCRPWNREYNFQVNDLQSGTTCQGEMQLRITGDGSQPVGRVDLYIDGLQVASRSGAGPMSFDSSQYADGHHEIRIVARSQGDIEFLARKILQVTFDNHRQQISLTAGKTSFNIGDSISVHAESGNDQGFEVLHNGRIVGSGTGRSGTVEIPASTLGRGPVVLTARGVADSAQKSAVSAPLELIIEGEILKRVVGR